jgi:hypothetical protein
MVGKKLINIPPRNQPMSKTQIAKHINVILGSFRVDIEPLFPTIGTPENRKSAKTVEITMPKHPEY